MREIFPHIRNMPRDCANHCLIIDWLLQLSRRTHNDCKQNVLFIHYFTCKKWQTGKEQKKKTFCWKWTNFYLKSNEKKNLFKPNKKKKNQKNRKQFVYEPRNHLKFITFAWSQYYLWGAHKSEYSAIRWKALYMYMYMFVAFLSAPMKKKKKRMHRDRFEEEQSQEK